MVDLLLGPWGPLLIFFLRIVDVSMGTMRTLFIMRGARIAAPTVAFFEILIWVMAAGAAVRNLGSPLHVVAYAGGFATGTAVGLWVERKLALGIATVQAFSRGDSDALADALRAEGHGVTEVAGEGQTGRIGIVSTVVRRRDVANVVERVEALDPEAFITVYEDTHVRRGWMPGVRGK